MDLVSSNQQYIDPMNATTSSSTLPSVSTLVDDRIDYVNGLISQELDWAHHARENRDQQVAELYRELNSLDQLMVDMQAGSLSEDQWTYVQEVLLNLRPSNLSHFWGQMPEEWVGKDLPFTVEGDSVTFVNCWRGSSTGRLREAVEFRYWLNA